MEGSIALMIPILAIVMGTLWLSGALTILAGKVPGKGHKEIVEELKKLREEVQSLRRENHDVILTFDTTMKHLERRLDHLEGGAVRPAITEPEQRQYLTQG